MRMRDVERDTTDEERMAWGECPVCHAEHGERCSPNVGIPLGRNIHGRPPTEGVHLARMREAPMRVRLVPVAEATPAPCYDAVGRLPTTSPHNLRSSV